MKENHAIQNERHHTRVRDGSGRGGDRCRTDGRRGADLLQSGGLGNHVSVTGQYSDQRCSARSLRASISGPGQHNVSSRRTSLRRRPPVAIDDRTGFTTPASRTAPYENDACLNRACAGELWYPRQLAGASLPPGTRRSRGLRSGQVVEGPMRIGCSKGPERTEAEDDQPLPPRRCRRSRRCPTRSRIRRGGQSVDRPQEGGQRLAGAGRRDDERVVTVGDRRPGLGLRRSGRGEGAGEPLPGERTEPPERICRARAHSAIVPRGSDKFYAILTTTLLTFG